MSFELSPWPIEIDTGALTVVNTDWLNTAFIGGNVRALGSNVAHRNGHWSPTAVHTDWPNAAFIGGNA